jgi:TetR/AcrR family transcriptional regulator, transcriptional repressor for nem operon
VAPPRKLESWATNLYQESQPVPGAAQLFFSEMPDSTKEPPAGKRERLVASAQTLLHQQGVERTTIAEVADAADVPPGNVYYYFKTKDELVEAAIAANSDRMEHLLGALERYRSPQARLKGFVRAIIEQRDVAARYGCPHGSLCQELDKRDDDLRRSSAELLELKLRWAERQFREMGRRDARELAVGLIAAHQGALLLSNTFRDPDLVLREGRRLERWIDSFV